MVILTNATDKFMVTKGYITIGYEPMKIWEIAYNYLILDVD